MTPPVGRPTTARPAVAPAGLPREDTAPTTTPRPKRQSSTSLAAPTEAPSGSSLLNALRENDADTKVQPSAAGGDVITPVSPDRIDDGSQPAPDTPAESAELRTGGHSGKRDKNIEKLESQIEQAAEAGSYSGIVAASNALQNEKVLNMMTEVAYATGQDMSTVAALDGTSGVDIVISSSTGINSDAAYVSGENDGELGDVIVDDDVIQQNQVVFDELLEAGAIDDNGNVVDAELLASLAATSLAGKTATLIGVHEMEHADQDESGLLDEVHAEIEDDIADTRAFMRRFGNEDMLAAVEHATIEGEMYRIEQLEVPAYTAQEQADIDGGYDKAGYISVDESGTPLPVEQATANIAAFQTEQLLPYGPSAGQTFTGMVPNDAAASLGAMAEADGGKRSPGKRSPGKRSPGSMIEAGTPVAAAFDSSLLLNVATTTIDGGKRSPGKRSPGSVIV